MAHREADYVGGTGDVRLPVKSGAFTQPFC